MFNGLLLKKKPLIAIILLLFLGITQHGNAQIIVDKNISELHIGKYLHLFEDKKKRVFT